MQSKFILANKDSLYYNLIIMYERSPITVRMYLNNTSPSKYAKSHNLDMNTFWRVIAGHARHKAIEKRLRDDGYGPELDKVIGRDYRNDNGK